MYKLLDLSLILEFTQILLKFLKAIPTFFCRIMSGRLGGGSQGINHLFSRLVWDLKRQTRPWFRSDLSLGFPSSISGSWQKSVWLCDSLTESHCFPHKDLLLSVSCFNYFFTRCGHKHICVYSMLVMLDRSSVLVAVQNYFHWGILLSRHIPVAFFWGSDMYLESIPNHLASSSIQSRHPPPPLQYPQACWPLWGIVTFPPKYD